LLLFEVIFTCCTPPLENPQKMDKAEGVWVGYFYDGTIDKEYTETYKDGVKISD